MPKKIFNLFVKASWKKKILVIILIFVISFFVGRRFFGNKENGFVFGVVERKNITETVSETGKVSSGGATEIKSPTNGVIEEVFVSNDESVTQGQKLFTVKGTASKEEKAASFATFQAAASALQQAENTRRSTTATVDKVHDDLKNAGDSETFLEKQTRTAAEVANDNAYDALLAARAALASAQLVYQATQNATVTSPVSGIVSNLSVVNGATVTASQSRPVLVLSSPGTAEVTLTVSESDINKINANKAAEIKVDVIKDKTYSGIVSRVDSIGVEAQGIIGFNVYVQITNADNKIKTGMTTDVDIFTNEASDALSVPNSAIKPFQGGRAVRILNKDTNEIEFLPIKPGLRGKEFTQILEGVEEGQEIIVSLSNENVKRSGPFGF